ncbi:MAG: hypothetical protein ACXV3D_07485 [Halobacteriota archaeon]
MQPITEDFADSLVSKIEATLRPQIRAARIEIQDGGLFLLVSAELSEGVQDDQVASLIDCGAKLLRREMPIRDGDYSWLLNLTRHGEIVKALPGGWRDLAP